MIFTVAQGQPLQTLKYNYLALLVLTHLTLKKALTSLLVLLNKLTFDKGNPDIESKGLLRLMNFNLVFNSITFFYIFQILKNICFYKFLILKHFFLN